jgi:uncharacterized membrane protein YfcA
MNQFVKAACIVLTGALVVICIAFDEPLQLIASNFAITPIAFVAAAFANATAVGGGFLFVPLFIFVYGLTPLAALKLSLATQAFGMSSGALGWGRKCIDMQALVIGGLASLVGMWVGTYALQLPPESIKPVFGWVSLFMFVVVMLEIRFGYGSTGEAAHFRPDLKCLGYVAATFAGGLITAWTAIAVGEFVALYLLFVYRVRIETAIGTGVAILALDSIAGLAFHVDAGGIRYDLLAFTVPGVLLGGFFGARMGRYLEQKMFSFSVMKAEGSKGFFSNSPLKLLFSLIILVDGASILVNAYL